MKGGINIQIVPVNIWSAIVSVLWLVFVAVVFIVSIVLIIVHFARKRKNDHFEDYVSKK